MHASMLRCRFWTLKPSATSWHVNCQEALRESYAWELLWHVTSTRMPMLLLSSSLAFSLLDLTALSHQILTLFELSFYTPPFKPDEHSNH
jgi:hypothetical protein